MTGSILQDGGQPPSPLSPLPLPGLSPTLPPPPPAPPLFSSLSDSSISPLSPPCSCLLIVSEALSLGPPTRLRSEGIAASQGGDWNVKMLSETASTQRDGGHTRREEAPAVSRSVSQRWLQVIYKTERGKETRSTLKKKKSSSGKSGFNLKKNSHTLHLVVRSLENRGNKKEIRLQRSWKERILRAELIHVLYKYTRRQTQRPPSWL